MALTPPASLTTTATTSKRPGVTRRWSADSSGRLAQLVLLGVWETGRGWGRSRGPAVLLTSTNSAWPSFATSRCAIACPDFSAWRTRSGEKRAPFFALECRRSSWYRSATRSSSSAIWKTDPRTISRLMSSMQRTGAVHDSRGQCPVRSPCAGPKPYWGYSRSPLPSSVPRHLRDDDAAATVATADPH